MKQNLTKMIAIIKRNWSEIKRVMELSQKTKYSWFEYSRQISNGLSNNVLTKSGNGSIIFFVEHLPEYAMMSNDYLKIAKNLTNDQILFIDNNREFLHTIK